MELNEFLFKDYKMKSKRRLSKRDKTFVGQYFDMNNPVKIIILLKQGDLIVYFKNKYF